MPYVFDRLFGADRARPLVEGDSCPVPTIARSIVKAHGGRLDRSSRPGEDATFIVSQPTDRPV